MSTGLQFSSHPDTKQPSVKLERLKVSGEMVFELANGKIRFFQNDASAVAVPLKRPNPLCTCRN